MIHNYKDLTGSKFGRLSVVADAGRSKHGAVMWKCICDCGSTCEKNGDSLKSGNTKSCGCLKDRLGGESQRDGSLYKSWRAMMRRCYEPSHHAYYRYGGRGISVCKEWHNFLTFAKDLGERPDGMTLDRIDNEGDYTPTNCKWSNKSEQARNRKKRDSRAKKYEHEGKALSIYEWAEKSGVNHITLRVRLKRGIALGVAIQNIDMRYANAGG